MADYTLDVGGAKLVLEYGEKKVFSWIFHNSNPAKPTSFQIVASTGVISVVGDNDYFQGLAKGDTVTLSGFTNAGNNGEKVVSAVADDGATLTIETTGLVDETSTAATITWAEGPDGPSPTQGDRYILELYRVTFDDGVIIFDPSEEVELDWGMATPGLDVIGRSEVRQHHTTAHHTTGRDAHHVSPAELIVVMHITAGQGGNSRINIALTVYRRS